MNDKYFVRQRNQRENISNVPATTQKKPNTNVTKKKEPAGPKLTPLENLAQQIQKLSKNLANPKDKERYLELKEKYYREFLMKINKSNNYDIKFPTSSFPPYKYYIGRGNNSILVRAALKTRFWWSMGDYDDWSDYNFLWTQWKSNKILESIKTHKEIQKKDEEKEGKEKSGAASESLLSTQPTDKESNGSHDNLITTPKRSKGSTLSALKKANTSVSSSGNKNNKLGITSNARNKKDDEEEKKEENITSHNLTTTNHQENNFHLSNKKAIYYNMKIYYESLG